MNWHSISLPLVVISALLYHVSQKHVPKDVNPFVVLAAAYVVAIGICLTGLLLTGENRKVSEILRGQNWLVAILLGIAAMGIELGFLYAYRSGWKVSTTATTSGSFSAIALALIGVLWFKESLTTVNMIGILLCVIGVVCINTR